jgi:superfamily II helicase
METHRINIGQVLVQKLSIMSGMFNGKPRDSRLASIIAARRIHISKTAQFIQLSVTVARSTVLRTLLFAST